ncbi:hypothetical protein HDU96_008637 [Phlyctochytrium bullatum]|nr:hypothetical protein HDU96_008637 [Phlyctochytrium bullatum]
MGEKKRKHTAIAADAPAPVTDVVSENKAKSDASSVDKKLKKKKKAVVEPEPEVEVEAVVEDAGPKKNKKKKKKAAAEAAEEEEEAVEAPRKRKGEEAAAADVAVNGKGAKKAKKADGEETNGKPAKKAKDAEEANGKPAKKAKKSASATDGPDLAKIAAEVVGGKKKGKTGAGRSWVFKYSDALLALTQKELDAFYTANAMSVTNAGTTFRPILNFSDLSLPAEFAAALSGFDKPTAIQSAAWGPVFEGRDLVGIAKTGSGKTLAFGLPALLKMQHVRAKREAMENGEEDVEVVKGSKHPRVLILSPTRELATQIQGSLDAVGATMGLRSIALYGGTNKGEQIKELKKGADIVVATPGRLMDLVQDGLCNLSEVFYFVLDEADRMLDKGFEPEIRKICEELKRNDLQTVMFSATWPTDVRKLSERYLKNPAQISIGSQDLSANTDITQKVEVIDPNMKRTRLLALLKDYTKNKKTKIIIFGLYKREVAQLEEFLLSKGYNVQSLQGDLAQEKRTKAINNFKDGTCPILIATDVAGRGIDIPDVEYVINYTYPLTTEDYCHRIGRTGRAGKKGIAYTFFTQHDKSHSGTLINVLKQAGQEVPPELMKFGTTVKKKLDPVYGAFTKEIDPNAKATKIRFDDD